MVTHEHSTILLTGATGYVGGQLLPALLDAGHTVRCLARRPERANLDARAQVVAGDVLTGAGLDAALDGVDATYYLVHSMGRGNKGDFAAQDRQGAETFGAAAARAGVSRTIYLGGLDDASVDNGESEHLRSRHEVGRILSEQTDGVVYAQAAMIIGAESASFVILRHLVKRLPVMLTPRWVDTRSQPISILDVVGALTTLGSMSAPPSEVQLGGAEVLTYRAMMGRFAAVMGRRAPAVLRVPVLTPRLSSYWVSLFTPVEAGLVRPLIDGLSTEMVVRIPPPAGINDTPLGFDEAVRRALAPSENYPPRP